ncbi:MAG: hypothetical protein OXM55_08610 [Bdellovibrionales bacterium]|nr:hypothetical protein [Bdellovibrionales bacterium]
MKSILFLFICLFFIQLSYAGIRKNCNKVFTDNNMRQFTETITRYFSDDKNKQNGEETKPIQPTIDKLVSEGKSRKEILRYLVTMGYLKVENTTTLNPLFDYILSKPSSEIVQLIKDNPSFLYEGTLMGLSPFFLIVFIGNKQVMEAAIEIDKTLVNSRNALEETPLHYTIDPEIATKLLYYNAWPDAQDKKGYVALHKMRNSETIETMLYYKADPNVRDRSGVFLIRYHKKFVSDLDIIALLNQARESQRLAKDNYVNDTLLEEEGKSNQPGINNIRQKNTKLTTTQTTENQNIEAKEIKKARKIQEAIAVRKKIATDQRDQLITHLADGIVAIFIRKMFANRRPVIQSFIGPHIRIYVNEATLAQNKYMSNIVIFNRTIEQEFEMKIVQAYHNTKNEQDSELHMRQYLSEVENIVNELAERLKQELQDTSVKAIKRMINKMNRILLKVKRTERKLNQNRNNPPHILDSLIRQSLIERYNK